MKLTILNFMSENLISNNIEYDPNKEEGDYKHLITRLKEIKATIALLEKILFK